MDLDPDPLRRGLEDATGAVRPDHAWDDLAALHAFAFALPLDRGGLDLGVSAQVPVERRLGADLLAPPGFRDTLLAADLLARTPGPAAAALLARIAAGEARVGVLGVLDSPSGRVDAHGRVDAVSAPLPPASWDALLVRATTASGPARDVLALVDPTGEGVFTDPVRAVQGDAERWRLLGARGEVLQTPEVGAVAVAPARVRQAARLAGIARAALAAATRHAGRRQQFGRPLLEFQTVGHRLATLLAEGDGVDLLVQEAAWRLDTGREVGVSAPQCLAAAAELALECSRLAVQLHGARGLVAGDVPERAYRLAAADAVRLGTPQSLWREAARARLSCTARWDDAAPGYSTNSVPAGVVVHIPAPATADIMNAPESRVASWNLPGGDVLARGSTPSQKAREAT